MSKKIKFKLLKTLALTLSISSLGAMAPNILFTKAYAEGQTGWVQSGGHWFYLNDGTNQTGWIYDSGNWYYCWSNGEMATSTTINGYYVNESGAWTTNTSLTSNSSGTELTGPNITGQGHRRVDISSQERDFQAAEQLSNHNLALSDDDLRLVKALTMNLAQGRTSIDEARPNCIGKVVGGKYKITDIKFFDQPFSVKTGTDTDQKVKSIKESSLADYNSTSLYKYDAYMVFSCGNDKSFVWEAMRAVVEFEAV